MCGKYKGAVILSVQNELGQNKQRHAAQDCAVYTDSDPRNTPVQGHCFPHFCAERIVHGQCNCTFR